MPVFISGIQNNSISAPQITHSLSVLETNQLRVPRKIIGIYYINGRKRINTLRKKAVLLNFIAGGIYIYLLTYLLTPWCRVFLEKLTGLQLVKKFPAFQGTRRFITALTSVRHLSLSWANPMPAMSTTKFHTHTKNRQNYSSIYLDLQIFG